MTIDEAIKKYGYRTVWFAAMNSAFRERVKTPRLIDGYPPKVFISYKWGDDSLKVWIARLASRLKESGFVVFLDQYEEMHDRVIDVANYVSNLAVSDYCISIITEEYCKAVGVYGGDSYSSKENWVFDEHQRSVDLQNRGELAIIWVLKSGNVLPIGISMNNTIDIRNVGNGIEAILRHFKYDGPSFSDDEIRRGNELLLNTDKLISVENPKQALDLLVSHSALHVIPEVRLQYARGLAVLGEREQALQINQEVMRTIKPGRRALFRSALVYGACQEFKRALVPLIHLSKVLFNQQAVNFYIGNYLDELESRDAAISHLSYANSLMEEDDPDLLNNLGYVLLKAERFPEAKIFLQRALQVDPRHILASKNLVWALFFLGETGEARRLAADFVKRFPGDYAFVELKNLVDNHQPGASEKKNDERALELICDRCRSILKLKAGSDYCADCGTVTSAGLSDKLCPCCGHRIAIKHFSGGYRASEEIKKVCPICHAGGLYPADEIGMHRNRKQNFVIATRPSPNILI